MTELTVNLVTELHPKHLNSRVIDHLRNNLLKQYTNKVYRNIIIKNIQLDVNDLRISTLDMYNKITVAVKITKYLQYKVGDVLEGILDLTEPQPLFRGDHVKMKIDDVVRQSDRILTSYGSKLGQDDKCTAVINVLDFCEGSHFFQGTVSLIDPSKQLE